MRRGFEIVVVWGAVFLLVSGCAGSGGDVDKRLEVAREEAARMQPPGRALSSFGRYEVLPVGIGPEVAVHEDKVAYAEKLAGMIADRLDPLLTSWESDGASGSGLLQIRPDIQRIKIVSGSARFWGGAMAGESTVDMNLVLIDGDTGETIASPRLVRSSNAMAGGWSVGATDQNLLNYVADIAYQYMADNY